MLSPSYKHEPSGEVKHRIDHFPSAARPFDQKKASNFLQRSTNQKSTCFANITRLVHNIPNPALSLEESVSQYQNTLVALSGGLDSFLIAALIHRATGKWPPVATLVSHFDEYCEVKETQRTAKRLGISELIIIETNEQEFLDSLPFAIKSLEVPLYNLHPVSKWIFANKIKEHGFNQCVTGDGADQLFSHDDGHDYLPLVGAIFSDLKVELICPLYRSDLSPTTPDHEKKFLRELGETLLPLGFAWKKKHRVMAPFFNLNRFCEYPRTFSEKEVTLHVTQQLLQVTHK